MFALLWTPRSVGEVLCCIRLKQSSNLIICVLRQFPHCNSLRSCRNLPQSGHSATTSPVSFTSCRLLERRVRFQRQCFPIGRLSGSLCQQSALRWWRSTAKPARSFSQSKEVGGRWLGNDKEAKGQHQRNCSVGRFVTIYLVTLKLLLLLRFCL